MALCFPLSLDLMTLTSTTRLTLTRIVRAFLTYASCLHLHDLKK